MEWAGDQVAGATFRARLAGEAVLEQSTGRCSPSSIRLSYFRLAPVTGRGGVSP